MRPAPPPRSDRSSEGSRSLHTAPPARGRRFGPILSRRRGPVKRTSFLVAVYNVVWCAQCRAFRGSQARFGSDGGLRKYSGSGLGWRLLGSRGLGRRVEETWEVDPTPRLEVTMQQLSPLHVDTRARPGPLCSRWSARRSRWGLLCAAVSAGVTACGGTETTPAAPRRPAPRRPAPRRRAPRRPAPATSAWAASSSTGSARASAHG